MKKAVVHYEIGCRDIEKTAEFYKTIFDWDITPIGSASLIHTDREDAISGHINQLGPDDLQRYVTVYIETDTLEDDLKAIESQGGKIMVPPVQLPDKRWFAWFKDIAGNTIGLITPK